MSDITRIISLSALFFLSFFCFQVGIFLWSGHKLKQNGRRTLIFIELFTGFMLLCDALAYLFRGNTSTLGWYIVRLSNLFVYICNFSISFFFCFYVCEFIKQSRLNFSLIFKISDLKADDLKKAANMQGSDYEDNLQMVCAARLKADFIVTRNIKDFTSSKVVAIKPSEIVELLKKVI